MKQYTKDYSVWQQILWVCDEREAPDSTYRYLAFLHLVLGYSIIIVPTFLVMDRWVGLSPYPELAQELLFIWKIAHVGLLASVVTAAVASTQLLGAPRMSLARMATYVYVILDVVTTLLFALIQGYDEAMPQFLIFLFTVMFRALLPYRYAFACCLATVLTMFIFWSWLYTIPDLAMYFIPHADTGSLNALTYFFGLATIAFIMLVLFCAVNYLVNQRNILENYLTNQVLARYLPPRLVAQASSGNLDFEHEPESRVLTVLFADLVGFTKMSTELGSVGVAKVINQFSTEVSELVHYHGGTVDKFIGDCVMVVFGAPDSMTTQAQAYRCTEMAEQMVEMVRTIDWGVPLSIRVGISTGEMVVGHFGSAVRSDYTVIGPAVNLAARLETVCPPGCVLVSEHTAELLGDSRALKKIGPLSLKGVGDDIYAWSFKVL
ncbi:MAG: adenylate/guanylate cyclase domain-containing protein [Deltaproteobacteria bacterium]|jgi:class 3 adenylate cyclase|nr:adenylate/guanylate cyclase domain-containing protein [Deltaproteobacteria bacterium]